MQSLQMKLLMCAAKVFPPSFHRQILESLELHVLVKFAALTYFPSSFKNSKITNIDFEHAANPRVLKICAEPSILNVDYPVKRSSLSRFNTCCKLSIFNADFA